MILRIKRKTAQITIRAVIIFVALAVILSLTLVNAGTSNIQKLPNMPIGQKSADIINVGSSQFNVSWEHINTYNLTKQEFILKVSQTNNSQTKNQIVTINPYLYLTDADFNLSNLPAGSIETTAYQYAPSVNYYYQKITNATCVNLSSATVQQFETYPPLITYTKGDLVIYNGEEYQCGGSAGYASCQNIYTPTQLPSYWTDLGAYTSPNSTNSTGWNYPQCNSSGQSVIVSNETVPWGSCTITANTTCLPFNTTIYSPVQIGSSSMNSTASMFKGSKTVQNADGSLTQLSNMSMYQLEVPAYSNTSQGTKYFKITINNVPINRTNGIHSTGTFLADIGGNLIWDKTHSSWWNTNYSHYVKLTMTANPGNITYYNFTSGNFSNNIKSDFSDIIPIALDNSTMYNFTRESYSSGNWATFRINNLGATSFYLYYNDSNAIYQGNASNVYYNPVSMYYLDGTSGSVVDSVGTNNGTVYGGVTRGVTGQIGNAFSFDGSTGRVQTPDSNSLDLTSAITMTAWIYRTGSGSGVDNERIILMKNNAYYFNYNANTGKVDVYLYGTSSPGYHSSTSGIPLNTGQFWGIVYNGTDIRIYKNGILDNTPVSSTGNIAITTTPLDMGGSASISRWFQGKIDGAGIWNKPLSVTLMKALSNQTAPAFTLSAEQSQVTAPPSNITITLNSPINNYNSSKNYILTNGTVTSTYPIANLSVWTNITGTWALNQTNTSVVTNNSAYTFNLTNIPDGTYKWAYQTYDNQSVANFSTNRTFTVDTTKPSVTILYPTPGSYGYLVTQLNYSATDTHLSKCWYSIDSGTNSTPNSCNANFTISVADGSHTATVYANDTFGNVGSNSVSFIQDTTPPVVTLISPANGSNFTANLTQTFIANETDNINLSNATLHIFNSTGTEISSNQKNAPNNVYDLFDDYYGWSNVSNALYTNNSYAVNTIGNNFASSDVYDNGVSLAKQGNNYTGTDHSNPSAWPTTPTNITYGSPTDLWGTTWTPSEINNPAFGFRIAAVTNYKGADSLLLNNFNFNIPSDANILGIEVNVTKYEGTPSISSTNAYVNNIKITVYYSLTSQITGTSNQTSWNFTLPNYGNYTWNVQSCDQVGNCNTSSNYTFEVLTGSTCIYSGSGNWNISLGDYCVIDTNTNLGLNNITFYGTGNVTLNATITTCNIGGLPANQIGYIGSNALINYGVCV